MKRIRYFTETLPANEDPHHPSQKAAGLPGDGQWIRISDQTIMGIADLTEVQFNEFLKDHPTVVMLPSLHDKKTMKEHYDKKNGGKHTEHLDHLRNHCGAKDTDTVADIVGKMLEKGHTFLSPDK